MKLYITFTKSKLAAMTASLILIMIIAFQIMSVCAKVGFDGSTNQKRVQFVHGIGYQISETCADEKSIIIPKKFGDVYERYNELQRQAGFNLEDYRGKAAVLYTYEIISEISDDKRAVHLIVFEGEIIGGDVADLRLGGEMLPLKRDNN